MIYGMDFVATLRGSAKLGEKFGILSAHSVRLVGGMESAVQHVALDAVAWLGLVAPARLLAAEPCPKAFLCRCAVVDATVFAGFVLLAGAPRRVFRPLDVVSRWLVLMLMPFKNKT